MALLIAIAVIQLIVIYIFSFKLQDRESYIEKLEIRNALLMDETRRLIELLGKKGK